MSAELCARVADEAEWGGWLADGVPPEITAHAEGCARCGAALAELGALQAGLQDLAARTARRAEALDVTEAVMARLDAAPSRRWPTVVGALALAAGAMLALRWATLPEPVQIEAEAATWTAAGEPPAAVRGAMQARLPGLLTTEASAASARGPGTLLTLAPQSSLHIADLRTLGPLAGAVSVEREAPFTLTHSAARVRGSGHIEIADGDSERGHMISRRSALGAAVVVVAVYAGWASLGTDRAEVQGQAPVGLAADAQGRVTSFPLGDETTAGQVALGGAGAGAAALTAATATATGADPAAGPTGAYWSEEDQAVRLALAGEVIDAVSGAPVSDFVLLAEAEALTGYGAERHERTISGAKEGRFRLDGLAQGRWRITARAEGYAPVTQAVDLTGLGADPYLVLPMSSGARLSGQVVDWRGQPAAEARVGLLECFGKSKKPGCRLVTTGADGRFVLEGVPAGPAFSVRAEHDRLGSAVQPNLRRKEGESEHIVLELSGVLKVFGKVTRGEDRTPVAGVKVTTADAELSTVTGPDGAYALSMPLQNRPQVYVATDNGRGQAVEFGSYPERRSSEAILWVDAPGHVAELEKNFRLAMDDARLFGRITDAAGAPVANVKLRLWNSTGWYKGERGHETFPERTTTDADGRYAIEGVPVKAGYQLQYIGADDERRPLGYVNVSEPGDVEANFQLGAARIRGQFVHPDTQAAFHLGGHSCSRFGAERLDDGARYFIFPHCLDDGRFELEGLPPGRYRLHDRAEWMDSPVKIDPVDVTVAPNQILEGVKVPVTGDESDTWRLRVLDERGRFVPGLYLRYMGKNASFTMNLETDDKGTARASVNRAYKTVFVDAQGHASAEVPLAGRDPKQVIEVQMKRLDPAR